MGDPRESIIAALVELSRQGIGAATLMTALTDKGYRANDVSLAFQAALERGNIRVGSGLQIVSTPPIGTIEK